MITVGKEREGERYEVGDREITSGVARARFNRRHIVFVGLRQQIRPPSYIPHNRNRFVIELGREKPPLINGSVSVKSRA